MTRPDPAAVRARPAGRRAETVQDLAQSVRAELDAVPSLPVRGKVISRRGVTVPAGGTVEVIHGLGQAHGGWIVARSYGAQDGYPVEVPGSDATRVVLSNTGAADMLLDVWVF